MLSLIEQKMCVDDSKVWSRDLKKTNQPATLLGLMTWMTAEMKSRMRATAPLRTRSSHYAIHHVNVTAGSRSKTKSGSHRCWICKTPSTLDRQMSKILKNASTSHKKITPVSAV